MREQQLENFGIWIPKCLSSRKDITPAAKIVFGYIDGFTRNGKTCYASNATIGKWSGLSPDTVSDSVTKLVALGLLQRSIRAKDGNARDLVTVMVITEENTLSDKTPLPIGKNTPTLSDKTPHNSIGDNIDKIKTPIPPEGDCADEEINTTIDQLKSVYEPNAWKRSSKKKIIESLAKIRKSGYKLSDVVSAAKKKANRVRRYQNGESHSFEPAFPWPERFLRADYVRNNWLTVGNLVEPSVSTSAGVYDGWSCNGGKGND